MHNSIHMHRIAVNKNRDTNILYRYTVRFRGLRLAAVGSRFGVLLAVSIGALYSIVQSDYLNRMPRKSRSMSATATALRLITFPVKAVIALVVLVDEILRPIYRPLIDRIVANPFFRFLDRQVSALPRWAILIVFAVPFLVAEPLKLVAVILFAKGRVVLGATTFLLAQLLTFVLVERIYHAGRAKLLSYWWFAWVAGRVADVRDAILAFSRPIIRRIRIFVRRHA